MIPLLLTLSLSGVDARAAQADEPPVAPRADAEAYATTATHALRWKWGEPQRFYVETEVHLPVPMWFTAVRNKEARVVAYLVRAVLDCDDARPELKHSWEVVCDVEDVALSAVGLRPGVEPLQLVLDELDERLSGAAMQLQVHEDGRVLNIDIEGLDRPRRRVGLMNERLRLVMSRAIAGLDLQVPVTPVGVGSQWPQYRTWFMTAPSDRGTAGAAEVLHHVDDVFPDGRLLITTVGRGVIVPAGGNDKYDTELVSWSVFDPATGFLTERAWGAAGVATPSSPVSYALAELPYDQRGRIRRLAPGEQVDVGESLVIDLGVRRPTTLQR